MVENTPGAGGTLGTNKAMKAPADGYTMMMTSPIEMIFGPLNYNSAQYKPEDARTILMIGHTDVVLVTRKGLPVSNLAELVALMKANSQKPLAYCSPGTGSLYHLIGEKLNMVAGVKSVHAPYNGFPQCVNDLAGDTTVDFAFLPLAGPFPGFIDSGNIKAIAVLSTGANSRFPKLPTASTTKGFEDFAFSIWAGIQVNGKVPDAVAEVLLKHATAALAKPEVRTSIEKTGSVLYQPMTLKQAQDEYIKDIALYTSISKSVGLPKQ
jgi:tripartite-type tricarboxylate transporter receptor subunit TctC